MATKNFIFFTDPGHGWLRVPLKEIERLGIADKISNYSYQKNKMAFLEEDCDAGVFLEAKKAAGEAVNILTARTDRQSKIRKYAMFGGDRMVTRKNALTGAEFQERADTTYYCSPSSETYWCQ